MTDWWSERATSDRHRSDLQYKQHADRLMLRVTLASTIVAVIAAAAAIWSGYEAHKARVYDERPFLAVDIVLTPDQLPRVAPEVLFKTSIAAFGKSPARNIRYSCADVPLDQPNDAHWPPEEIKRNPPNHILYILPARSFEIECKDLLGNYSGVAPQFIEFGFVEYQDDHDTAYRTPFCYEVSLTTPGHSFLSPCGAQMGLPDLQ
jgi:hypothetical protein